MVLVEIKLYAAQTSCGQFSSTALYELLTLATAQLFAFLTLVSRDLLAVARYRVSEFQEPENQVLEKYLICKNV